MGRQARNDMRGPDAQEGFDPVIVAPVPASILRPDFAWIDCEASSLHVGSYPIEIGWAFDDLSGESFLIRPEPDWTDWSQQAQEIHGISRAELEERGIPAAEAAARLNRALAGRHVFSDTVDNEGKGGMDMLWLRRLFVAAGFPVQFRMFNPNLGLGKHLHLDSRAKVDALLPRLALAEELAERCYPHTHRAAEDSVSMAASFRMTVDDAFLDAVREHERSLAPRGAARR